MIKHCVICGAEFSAPPSDVRRTCSRDCSSKYRSARRKGKPHPWSDSAKASARLAAAKTGNLKNGTAAAMRLPEGQRGEQNREAKLWCLVSPDGELETVINLLHWARTHAEDYFGFEPTDENARRIASGIRQIKRSAEGNIWRKGKPVSISSYKGWQLVGWGDGNTTKKD